MRIIKKTKIGLKESQLTKVGVARERSDQSEASTNPEAGSRDTKLSRSSAVTERCVSWYLQRLGLSFYTGVLPRTVTFTPLGNEVSSIEMYKRLDVYMKRYPTEAVFVQEYKGTYHFHGIVFRHHHLKEELYSQYKGLQVYQEALNPALNWIIYMNKTKPDHFIYYNKQGDRIKTLKQNKLSLKKKSEVII